MVMPMSARAADYTVVVDPSVRKVAGVRGVITKLPFSLLLVERQRNSRRNKSLTVPLEKITKGIIGPR